ncbi:MAG: ubiquinol-cytochrome c reductase iron-sulfur subunit [Candidatus Zixiibacteriota bacterium]|nr:MAG: ubiquinol-cytochrome c reductase iron-sulfur subunit [candidate division Zixibacteria bacterium]
MSETIKNRRGFLAWLFRGSAVAFLGSVFYPIFKYVLPPETIEANVSQIKLPFKIDELREAEQASRIFKFGQNLGIILISPDNEIRAYSALCTHLDCTVQYRKDMGIIWCACHNGKYDLEGRNISGPPPRPLEMYAVHVDEVTGEIYITRGTG